MTSRRTSTMRLVHDVVDDSKSLWDRRVPYPIERGARRVAFSHLWNEGPVTPLELVGLRRRVDELSAAVDRLIIATRAS
jgi:hypothetical protein